MIPKVFLSLSHADADFVRAVHKRLPYGLAYFYESSFNNGEKLLDAMRRVANDAGVFVLFASAAAAASPWVGFEVDQARIQQIKSTKHRILIFPTDGTFAFTDLPEWLRDYWVPKGGALPSDVARYITSFLLTPSSGSDAATRIVGRGKAQDRLEQLSAAHLERTRKMPSVYFLSGFRGVGRRTFATYFMKNFLSAEANLAFGPTILVSPQADIQDIYLGLRMEITPDLPKASAVSEFAAFQALSEAEQIQEIVRLVGHFADLGQSVTLVSAGGFFEDTGLPKTWVAPLLSAIESPATLFVVSNRQLPADVIEKAQTIVQMRVGELADRDVRSLMTFSAARLGVEDFAVSDQLVSAIGGHADVANAAVRLAALKGLHVLQRDPAQLFNIQNLILGESIDESALGETERKVLSLLSWVPRLNAELLWEALSSVGVSDDDYVSALEGLVLGCLVVPYGANYAISSSIRHLFRRLHVTSPELIQALSSRLRSEWGAAVQQGELRVDLIETFAFMHSLEGALLPKEFAALLTPGMLSDVMKEMYARGKDEADRDQLERVLKWGGLAADMKMTEAAREEIMGTMARAATRLGKYTEAEQVVNSMREKGYRSVPFLRGHLLRKQEKYDEAIVLLVEAVRGKKVQRSAVHELALAYQRSRKIPELNKLLSEYGELLGDSAMFLDLRIGLDLARRDFTAAETKIELLKRLPDDEGRSDTKSAQLSMARGHYDVAAEQLGNALKHNRGATLKIRCIRAACLIRLGKFDLAKRDIEIVKQFPSWQRNVTRLDAAVLVEQKNTKAARALLDGLDYRTPEDWLLYARALEVEAELPQTGLAERAPLRTRASEIRSRYSLSLEDDFDAD